MKKTFVLLFFFFVAETAMLNAATTKFSVSISNPPGSVIPAHTNDMLLQQFLNLTPKKYYALTGKKLNLGQKISLKLTQRKVKRMIRKGEPIDLVAMQKRLDTSDFNLLGFLLGLILNVIGVLIAYLIGHDNPNLIKWAWIGVVIQSILILVAIIIF
jgi:hypothetical protein